MAVLGRLLISSAERVDLSDLLSIDSYTAGDFKYFIKSMVGDSRPYILKGFDVIDPLSAIGTQSCSIRVANSVVYYPGSSAGSFFYGLDENNSQSAPLVPELRKNATNYVYLTFSTFNTSVDTRAFWDPDKDGGAGGEFTQDVNTESVLKVDVNVSTGSFPANTIPIAKIVVGAVTIESIEDARHLMYRLGTGGITPDPLNTYSWQSSPSPSYKRAEPPTKTYAGGVNPFQGADKNIATMKEWMDAIMSKIRELGGTTYWYEDTSTYGLVSGFIDACATSFKSKGKWQHDSSTPGLLTWTEDLNIKVTSDFRTYIIRSGSHTLLDEQVMYIPMVRQQPINPTDEAVAWANGANYVNTIGGAVGLFANLAKGDYIKKVSDSNDKFLRVEEFYDAVSLGGSTTSAATAKSIRLSSAYLGLSSDEKARYDKGVYSASDIIVSDRNQVAISEIGGNFHWLAMRSDTIQKISTIVSTSLTLDIENHDGVTAKVTSASPHGLVDGDRLTIYNSINFNGTFKVEVESSTVFYISVAGGPFADELTVEGAYATVTTAIRDNGYSLQLESANHGFNSDDMVTISGTTNYNHLTPISISVRNSTQFTIPVSSNFATETSVGITTLAKIAVRTEGTIAQIVQGEIVDIGVNAADNIKTYIGMSSISQTSPEYFVPTSGYNTLNGMANYNSLSSENLTARVSKLTAMMADKAQDKTIKILPANYESVTNTTNISNQDITFNSLSSSGRIDIAMPGSDYNYGSVILSGTISLPTNSVAYISVDRNTVFSYANLAAVTVKSVVDVAVDENIFVLALRLGTSDVWLWDGSRISAGETAPVYTQLTKIVQQNQTSKLVRGGAWSWNSSTNTLSNSLNAYIQVSGLTETRNRILPQSIVLPSDGYVAYVSINRDAGVASSLTVNTSLISNLSLSNDVFIIARRLDNDVIVGSSLFLTTGESKALDAEDKVEKVIVVDTTSLTLPTGATATIDGVSLVNGDRVLFTNLTNTSLRGIHAVYGIGTSITWTQIDAFAGLANPFEGSLVAVKSGTYHNSIMGYYSGVWEPYNSLSSLYAAIKTNTIDNLNFAQTWNWSTITTDTPLSVAANALTTGSILKLTTSSSSLNSTLGLLHVANTGSSTSGIVARIQANSTSGSGITVLASGRVGIGTIGPVSPLHIDDSGSATTAVNITRSGTDTSGLRVLALANTHSSTVTDINRAIIGLKNDVSPRVDSGVTIGYIESTWSIAMRNNFVSSADSGTVNNLYGNYIEYGANNIDGTATPITTNAYGILIEPYYKSGSTTTNMYDIYLSNGSGGGTVTNRYALYSANTASSYFAGSLGVGTSTLSNVKFRSQYNFSDAAATQVNALINSSHTLTADNAVQARAVDGQLSINQGGFNATVSLASAGNIQAVRGYATASGASGTVTAIVGVSSDVRNLGAGTVTNSVGFHATGAINSGGGVLTNHIQYYGAASSAATNNYSFYSDMALGSNRWGLYINGTADNYFAGRVGIGTNAPNTSSILDLTSTTAAFLPPRMTSVQKNAISSPVAGMVVYDTTLNTIALYDGSSWMASEISKEVDFTIANNQSVAANITGLSFGTGTYRGFTIDYSIRRYVDSQQLVEVGSIRGIYNAKTTTWYLSNDFTGQDCGVTFTITAAGQIQYTSTFLNDNGYYGSMKYYVNRKYSYP